MEQTEPNELMTQECARRVIGATGISAALEFSSEVTPLRPSTGSVGDARDNAMAEAFFATLGCELLDRRSFA
jgi:putative transposase